MERSIPGTGRAVQQYHRREWTPKSRARNEPNLGQKAKCPLLAGIYLREDPRIYWLREPLGYEASNQTCYPFGFKSRCFTRIDVFPLKVRISSV